MRLIFALIGTANLAIWPMIASIVFGLNFSLETIFAVAALMFIVIAVLPEAFLEYFAAIVVGGMWYVMMFGLIGGPAFFILKDAFDLALPGWSVLPIGLASLISLICLTNIFSRDKRAKLKPPEI